MSISDIDKNVPSDIRHIVPAHKYLLQSTMKTLPYESHPNNPHGN